MNDYPALNGEQVTERHARICADRGHATRMVDGVDLGICPRCGDVTTADTDPARSLEDDTLGPAPAVPGNLPAEGHHPMSHVTIWCRDGACNVEGHTAQNCQNRAKATRSPAQPGRETVVMWRDGASRAVIGYRDELTLPRHMRDVWIEGAS